MQQRVERGEIGGRADIRPRAGVELAADPAAADPVLPQGKHFEPREAREFREQRRVVEADVAVDERLAAVEREHAVAQREIAARQLAACTGP